MKSLEMEYGDTKNDSSIRSVNSDKDTTKVLRTHQKKYFKYYGNNKLLFTDNREQL
jgi:hypothetical protein